MSDGPTVARHRPRRDRVAITLAVTAAVVAAVLVLDQDESAAPVAEAEAPRVVSAEEFCDAFKTLNFAHGANINAPSSQATQQLKDAAAAVAGLAGGLEMSDRAKAGVAFITTQVRDLDEVATVEEIDAFGEDASLQDTANAKALGEYVADNCVAKAASDPK